MLIQVNKKDKTVLFTLYQECWPQPIPIHPDNLPVEMCVALKDDLSKISNALDEYLLNKRFDEYAEYVMNKTDINDDVKSES